MSISLVALFLDDSGEFTEFIGVVMDITERKHAEEALTGFRAACARTS